MQAAARTRTLFFLAVALIGMIVVGAALPTLDLKPGIPLTGEVGTAAALNAETLPPLAISVSSLFKAIMAALLTLAGIYTIYRLIRGTPWGEIWRPLLALLGVALALLVVVFLLTRIKINFQPGQPEVPPPLPTIPGVPLGPLPPFLIWLAWIGLGCLFLYAAYLLMQHFRKPARVANPLILEVQRAIEALQAGGDYRNVIIRCYQQMSLAVQEDLGIQRDEAVTAREFEARLEAEGVPRESVEQLTRLFEAARYGYRPAAQAEEQRAMQCLNEIVAYSRKGGNSATQKT